jgi:hypothetical protein
MTAGIFGKEMGIRFSLFYIRSTCPVMMIAGSEVGGHYAEISSDPLP